MIDSKKASSRAARHPGLCRDYERWLWQPLPAELAQCGAPVGLEAGDVHTRRGDAERERLPPVLERGVLDVHRDGAVDDVADSSRAKEVGQVAGPAAGTGRPSLDLRIERLGSIPERTDRAAVGEVPHACGDDAAVPRPPRHLAEACDRIVHDVDHELGERRIEAASFERQILSARMTWTPGWRPRRAATNSSDGSTAVTRSGPALRASSAVSAPGPHPTSRTRPSSGSPAKSAKGTASGLE